MVPTERDPAGWPDDLLGSSSKFFFLEKVLQLPSNPLAVIGGLSFAAWVLRIRVRKKSGVGLTRIGIF